MATTFAAMRARLGDTEYYVLSMKAQDLVNRTKNGTALHDWTNLSVEERCRHEIDYDRIRTHIAPYLANDDARFFGAVVVAARHFDRNVEFEPLRAGLVKGLPFGYRLETQDVGFLHFRGGELLVPLDGRHRLKAVEFALNGRDERNRPLPNARPCAQLAQDDVTVILVPYEEGKVRRIFTRMNRRAKPPSAAQRIVADDDDVVAVLSRDVANRLVGGRLTRYDGAALNRKDAEFTTLAILYNCNEEIVRRTFPEGKLDKTRLPDSAKQRLFWKKIMEVWETVLEGIDVFADALDDRDESGDEKRREIRRTNLLGKPVAQECLVRAFVRLTGAPTNMAADEACKRLNRLPWSMTEENLEKWQRVLWNGGTDGRIITKNRKLATALIAWAAGERVGEEAQAELLADYRRQFPEGERDRELPALS